MSNAKRIENYLIEAAKTDSELAAKLDLTKMPDCLAAIDKQCYNIATSSGKGKACLIEEETVHGWAKDFFMGRAFNGKAEDNVLQGATANTTKNKEECLSDKAIEEIKQAAFKEAKKEAMKELREEARKAAEEKAAAKAEKAAQKAAAKAGKAAQKAAELAAEQSNIISLF